MEGTRARVRVLERHHSRSTKATETATLVRAAPPKRLVAPDEHVIAHAVESPEPPPPPPPEHRPPEPPKRHNNNKNASPQLLPSPSASSKNKKPSRIPLHSGGNSPEKSNNKKGGSGSLGRSSLLRQGVSLKSSKESLASSNLSHSKDSLNKLCSLPRKHGISSLPRPNNNNQAAKPASPLDASTKVRNSVNSANSNHKAASFWGSWWKIS